MRQLKVVQSITNRESASVEKYLQEISKLEMVGAAEEIVLSRQIRAGDTKAIDTLTKANLRFVVSVAKQYQHRGLSLPDLINEGNIGLIKAARYFDESKGFKFISYAVWWIRQSILLAINEKGRLVRLPGNQVGMRNRIQFCTSQLEQELERIPSVDEISQRSQVSTADVERISNSYVHHTSLDRPLGADNTENTLLDTLTNEQAGATMDHNTYTKSLSIEVERCLASLSSTQKIILCSYYGIGVSDSMSLASIGQHLKLSTERVRQIKKRTILQLQGQKKADLLKPFLG